MSANGTNRVAVLVQNAVAVLGFRSKGVFDMRASMEYALPSDRASLNTPQMRSQLENMTPENLRELVSDYKKDHKNRMAAKRRARARTPVDS